MIKKILAIAFLTLLATAPGWAKDGPKVPSIFVEQSEFKFPPTVEGQKVEHIYTVFNKGGQELRILNINPG